MLNIVYICIQWQTNGFMNFKKLHTILEAVNENNTSKDVENAFNKIGHKLAIISKTTMTTVRNVYRARRIEDLSEISKKQDLSYRLDLDNIGFGRANIEKEPMFYCISADDINDGHHACIVETLKQDECKSQKMVIGEWRLKTELQLPIIDYENSNDINSRESYFNIRILSKLLTSDNGYFEFYNFMSDRFSKEAENMHEYWITSYFTKQLIKLGYNGIVYDSVQTTKVGLTDVQCVALTPKIVDENLELVGAKYLELNYSKDGIEPIKIKNIDTSVLI